MRVFLVDFENVKSEGLRCVDCLAQGDQVITFFSKNAESISMDTYFNLIHSKASFYAVRLDRTGKNALDFQLVSYLGYLMGTSEHQDVYVISTDHGFYSAVSFCRNFLIPQSKYRKTVTQYPSIASLFPNQPNGRAEGINAIPLFLKNDIESPVIAPVEIAPEQPIVQPEEIVAPAEVPVEQPAAEEKQPEPVKEVKEVKEPAPEAVSVQPKRRSNSRQGNGERGSRDNHDGRDKRDNRDNRDRHSAPQSAKSDSGWDEISAAAEVGLQVIDMFGGMAPKEQTPKQQPVQPVKEPIKEKAVEKADADQPIEIIDLLSPIIEPEAKQELKPVEQPAEAEQPVEQAKPEEAVEAAESIEATDAPQQPMAEPVMEPTLDSTVNGAEIDQMLEEFLEEAAAAVQESLKDEPAFIEVGSEQPVEEAKPDAEQEQKTEEKPQKNQPRTRRGRPRKVKPQAEQSIAENKPESKEQPKAEPAKSEQPKQKTEQPKPAKSEQPKPEKTEPEKSEQPVKHVTPEARELVKKVLTGTLEMKDEETGDDLEKLTDCIVNASGKQDLYRMIIKIFGQKTGLEYYKVVKREYTNISNQINKK